MAISPTIVKRLVKLGFSIQIEKGAGESSGYSDNLYEKNGANIVSTQEIWEKSEIIIKVRAPSDYNKKLG